MGVQNLPNTGNKFTGSRIFIPGIGISTYKVQKNEEISIRDNQYAGYINPSVTPTKSITPTPTITPTITPTFTPSPTVTPTVTPTLSPVPAQTFTFSASSATVVSISFGLNSSGFASGGYVDWGDGNTSSILNYTSSSYSNTYSSPYTGLITIYYFGNINQFTLSNSTTPNNSNVVIVDTVELSTLVSLTLLQWSRGRVIGQFSDLPATLTNLNITWDYTTSTTNDLPINLVIISLGQLGNTQLTGDISGISNLTNLTLFSVSNGNTISGDISGLTNSSLATFVVSGNNTISGDTVNMNLPSLTTINLGGQNTVTGNIVNFPPTLVNLTFSGSHSLYGDISNFNANLQSIAITSGTGAIIGDLSDLPNSTYSVINLDGVNNLITGNTMTIPNISGSSFQVDFDYIYGDLSDLFSGNKYPNCIFNISSYNPNLLTYTNGVTSWGTETMALFTLQLGSYPLTSTENDNLLIDLDSYGGGVTWSSCYPTKTITLRGTRTSLSDTAVTSLNSKGVTITLTP